jgi:hypothetical protein
MIKHKIITLMVMIILSGGISNPSFLAADVCINGSNIGDEDMWDFIGDKGWSYWELRDGMNALYNLPSSDWDGGWGYFKWDEEDAFIYAYPKMMNAGLMLLIGISDNVKSQADWNTRARWIEGGAPAAISRTSDTIEVFLRASDSRLCRLTHSSSNGEWVIGDAPPSTSIDYIPIICNCEKEIGMGSDPVAISRGENNIDIFFESGSELYRKTWNSDSGWGVEPVTQMTNLRAGQESIPEYDRYFIHTKPVVVQRSFDTFDVFAFDDVWNHLIHFFWSADYGWHAKDITMLTNGQSISSQSDPIAIARNVDVLDVFVVNTNGNLIHYFGSPSTTNWAVEKIGDLSPDSRPVVLKTGTNQLDVFANENFHLVNYHWSSSTGWVKKDLTQQLGDSLYDIDGNPAAVLLDQATGQSIHVFARGGNFLRDLVHFYYSPGTGWLGEDLTNSAGLTVGYTGDPIAASREERLDVVILNDFGHLIHYYWTPASSWLADNVHMGPNISPFSDTLEGTPIIVSRNEYTVDVVAREGNQVRLMTSAIGLTLTPWHTDSEYSNFAAGSLHQFKYEPENDEDGWAEADWTPIFGDGVNMQCLSFNGELFGIMNPALRASLMLHEAAHMNFRYDHDSCNDEDCDWWYFHTLLDPLYTLGRGTVPASGSNFVTEANHSPYQLNVEYLSDIAEFPSSDLPASTYEQAQLYAIQFLDDRISNDPGWRPGVPRPIN